MRTARRDKRRNRRRQAVSRAGESGRRRGSEWDARAAGGSRRPGRGDAGGNGRPGGGIPPDIRGQAEGTMDSGQLMNFGQVIRQARKAAGLTLEELAERSGLGVRTISDIERGRTTRPRSATVSLLCPPLGLPLPDGTA